MNPNEPAFPMSATLDPRTGQPWNEHQTGMTIRLYIATHALQGFLEADWDLPYEELASLSLKAADALIEQEKNH